MAVIFVTVFLAAVPGCGSLQHPPHVSEKEALSSLRTTLEGQLAQDIATKGPDTTQSAKLKERLAVVAGKLGSIDDIRCSAKFCRVEITEPNLAGYSDFVSKAFFGPTAAWHGAFTITTTETLAAPAGQSRLKTVIFVGPDPGNQFLIPAECDPCRNPSVPAVTRPPVP
jgi:hypothetical protein